MNLPSKVLVITSLFFSVIAHANLDASAQAIEGFKKSPQVLARVEKISAAGFKFTPEDPVVVLKHYYSGSYSVLERGYLVSQIYRGTEQPWGRATNISAVVSLDAYGNIRSVDVLDLPKSGLNDINGGSDEN